MGDELTCQIVLLMATTFNNATMIIWGKSKKDSKDQESIQSSTTTGTGYQMEK